MKYAEDMQQMDTRQAIQGQCSPGQLDHTTSAKTFPHPPSLPRTTQQIQRLETFAMELRDELNQCHSMLDNFFGYADAPPMGQAENRAISNPSEHLSGTVDVVEENMNLAAQLRRRLAEYL